VSWPLVYVLIGVGAAIVAAATTPLCRRLAKTFGVMDRPAGESHKAHGAATPLLGGMAMLSAWLIVILGGVTVLFLGPDLLPEHIAGIIPGARSVLGLLGVVAGGAAAITIMGLIDDRIAMGPGKKLFLQILICGLTALYPKIRITLFWDQPLLTWCITVFWLVFVVNAFNFLDNMDGLAAGIALIGSVLFTIVAAIQDQNFVATLGAATSGVSLGFLFFNKSPASIFMGDSGSHFLGYVLGVMATLTLFYNEQAPTTAPVLIPIFILALPIFDTFAVVVIRLRNGKPIYHGDHNHISHRFHHMGLSRKTAVQLVHLLAIAIGLGALPLLWLDTRGVILVLLQAAAMLMLITLLHARLRKEK